MLGLKTIDDLIVGFLSWLVSGDFMQLFRWLRPHPLWYPALV